MARFSQRNVRLARQRESYIFRSYIMPVSLLMGFAGLLAVLSLLVDQRIHERREEGVFLLAILAVLSPVVAFLFRWVRGHFNRQLGNP